MRNCLILGSGRSGTSMVAGMLAGAGYYMGRAPLAYGVREANPNGFFEDPEINRINEELLGGLMPRRRGRAVVGAGWLARVPVGTALDPPGDGLAERMTAEAGNEPFCFKDPRFSYTLPGWRPVLPDTLHLCVFREPNRTAQSIAAECSAADYLRPLRLGYDDALATWTLMYRHILERHATSGDWLFLHYDQVLEGDGADRLEAATRARVDRSVPDPSLRRTAAEGDVPAEAAELYRRLCDLAGAAGR